MDISTGKKIIEAAVSIDKILGKIDTIISKMEDEKERNVWISRLGNAIMVINEEIILPVEREFPELKT